MAQANQATLADQAHLPATAVIQDTAEAAAQAALVLTIAHAAAVHQVLAAAAEATAAVEASQVAVHVAEEVSLAAVAEASQVEAHAAVAEADVNTLQNFLRIKNEENTFRNITFCNNGFGCSSECRRCRSFFDD